MADRGAESWTIRPSLTSREEETGDHNKANIDPLGPRLVHCQAQHNPLEHYCRSDGFDALCNKCVEWLTGMVSKLLDLDRKLPVELDGIVIGKNT